MITAVPYATGTKRQARERAASTDPDMLHDNRLYVSQSETMRLWQSALASAWGFFKSECVDAREDCARKRELHYPLNVVSLEMGGKLQLLSCVSKAPTRPDRGQHPCPIALYPQPAWCRKPDIQPVKNAQDSKRTERLEGQEAQESHLPGVKGGEGTGLANG